MKNYLERGRLLFTQQRFQEATTELRKELATDPTNAYAMGLMAECYIAQSDYPHAVEMAEKAIGAETAEPLLYYILGRSYFYAQRIPDAREAIHAGQRIAPTNPDFFLLKGNIEYYEEQWAKALDNAERGLEMDAEGVELINLRARALIQLNRTEEAEMTLDYALHKAPENAYAHANKGWVAIEKDAYDTAVLHFREALRLEPMNEFAQSGLKEAIKGKNVLYRYILKYFIWMGKQTEGNRWGIIIGMYILYRAILWVAKTYPSLAIMLYPVIFLYIVFVFSSWIAVPISNLFLRLHPLGKYALDEDEILASNIVGILGVGGILTLISYYLFQIESLSLIGGLCMILLIPVGGLFSVSKGSKARRSLLIYTLVLAALGIIFIVNSNMIWAIGLFFLGIFAYSWVANYFIAKDAKAF